MAKTKKPTKSAAKNTKPTKNTVGTVKKPLFALPIAWVRRSKYHTAAAFMLAFGSIGLITILISSASTTSISLETESMTVQGTCINSISDATASGGNALKLNCSPSTTTGGFVHPGILIDKSQLDLVKAKVAANQEPWISAYNKVLTSGSTTKTTLRPTSQRFSSLSYVPAPVSVVKCPASYGTNLGYASIGCSEQTDDAVAAYTQALLYYYTGNEAYAKKSIEIMNAWSGTLTAILFDQPRSADNKIIYENGKLQAGWSAQSITRAAEIIRYTYNGWSATDIQRFENMLNTIHLPLVKSGWTSNANWFTTFAEAMINIGVFTNNKETYDAGIAYWREKIPTIIYLTSDGSQPFPPSSTFTSSTSIKSLWNNPTSYINGLETETCRDMGHTMMGLSGMSYAAETARIQGIDLFGEQEQRIVAGYELQASYMNQLLDQMSATGQTAPGVVATGWKPATNWVCSSFKDGGWSAMIGFEVFYNHYAGRKGISLPNTEKVVQRLRPTGAGLHMDWETLTHANTSSAATDASATGSSTGLLNAPATDTYQLWVRMKAADISNNAVQADLNGTTYKVGDSAALTTSWTWVNYQNGDTNNKISLPLAQGDHTIKLTAIEPGVQVDRIIIVKGSCVPNELGNNCTNLAPSISLTNPTTGSSFTEPDSISLVANANDTDGSIAKVEFYNGSNKLGESLTAPYTFIWNNAPAGNYSVSAKAIDNLGASTDSSVATITVNPAPVVVAPLPTPTGFRVKSVGNGQVTLQWNASADSRVNAYALRYSSAASTTVNTYSTWTYPAYIKGTSITLTGLKNNQKYYFQLRSVNDNNTSSTTDDQKSDYTQTLEGTPKKRYLLF